MKKNYFKLVSLLVILLISVMCMTACAKDNQTDGEVTDSSKNNQKTEENYDGKLVFDHSLELKYAKNFSLDYYKGGYMLIKVSDGKQFLTIPEGMSVPSEVKSDVVILQMPLNNLLISSTPTMSLFSSIDQLDKVSLTTTDKDDWYIEEVVECMDKGSMKFIGSYKAPDYEMLAVQAPPFAIFSNMLSSVPEVAEKLDELKIPYLLDQASYEEEPMARVEWVKLYGALFDCEEKANEVFNTQVSYIDNIDVENLGDKTVAAFYITSKGVLHARQGGDYMSKMIDMAGGKYIFADMNPDKTGTQKIEFEEFYKTAKDADYIIYIWSIGGKPETLEDFVSKNELFKDFKAVKDGNVWCTTPDYFQISDTLGHMIKDINEMLTLEDASVDKFQHLFRLK